MMKLFTTFAIVFFVFALGFTVIEYIFSMVLSKESGRKNIVNEKIVAYFCIFITSWICVFLIEYKSYTHFIDNLNIYWKIVLLFLLWIFGGLLYSSIKRIIYKIAS